MPYESKGSTTKVRVGLVAGFWSQNIGNAFFNLGGRALLESAGAKVFMVQDSPAYWTFRGEHKGAYDRAWALLENLDLDLVVLQGPLFTRNFANIWIDTLKHLKSRGINWGILSGGFRSYSDEERQVARSVLNAHEPMFVSTRDCATADTLRVFYPRVRQGVDSAFFLRWAYEPPELDKSTGDFINLCFDHFVEPDFIADRDGPHIFGDRSYRLEHRRLLNRIASRTKGHAYLAQMLDRRRAPEMIADRRVVRPEHRTNPHVPVKIYKRPNAIASDEPWTYLTVYANGECTISDRVHACVAALAYGKSALLHNPTTKRSQLFDAIGASGVTSQLTALPLGRVDGEFDEAREYLSKVLDGRSPWRVS